jgi:hypothetical protein
MKLSAQTQKLLGGLAPETRAKVDRIIRRHLAACLRNGSPIESFDRLYTEAVEVVALEDRFPDAPLPFTPPPSWEPARRYDQYVSPCDM